jgi:Spy/CpxP family protein refolding chaperone
MAEEQGTSTENETGTEETTEAPDIAAELAKWKAMSRKHEAQAKANADAANKLKELEDAGKSEAEKLTAKAAEAEDKAAKAEARALRLEIAAAKGLTPAQAKRLVGGTKEELEADADELLSTFKPADTAGESDKDDEPEPTGKPREALRPGTTSAGEEKESPIDEALKRIHPIN